jgi:hypothetical protein
VILRFQFPPWLTRINAGNVGQYAAGPATAKLRGAQSALSFVDVFAIATPVIAEREQKDSFAASDPRRGMGASSP